MKVILVGGIFGMSNEFRSLNLQVTAETALATGLRRLGVEVESQGHRFVNSIDGADLVHLHHLADSCVQFALRRRVPLVFTRHATKGIPWHHSRVLAMTYNRADCVVTLSNAERARLSGVVEDRRIRVIPNGVDSRQFQFVEREAPAHDRPWRLLYVGQLIELKRAHLALDLMAYMKASGFAVRLDVVSHRPRLEPELRLRAARLGLQDNVQFVGPSTQAEISQWMSRSHSLILPSRTEALSTVVTEACLSGLPVLAFNVGGIREQLPPSIRTPAVDDLNAFVRSGVRLATQYRAEVTAYRAHHAAAAERFSLDAMVLRHLELYRSLVYR